MQAKVVDAERLKQNHDLRHHAGRYTTLRRWAQGELAGPCPNGCGALRDGFHVRADWFKCYRCHPMRGDIFDFYRWREGWPFPETAAFLSSQPPPAAPPPPRPTTAAPPGWQSPDWQARARQRVARAAACLDSPAGAPGADFLRARAIEPDTWRAWGLGYRPDIWHPARRAPAPAIVLPWCGRGLVKAIQYRFIGEAGPAASRFSQERGGQRTLFGTHLLRPGPGRALLLVEGELNAVSIWQAGRDLGIDTVSWGPEGNITGGEVAPKAAALARRYGTVIVWADKAERAALARSAVGPQAIPLCSPRALDANDLLRAGLLADFLAGLLAQCLLSAAAPLPGVETLATI